MLQELPLSAKRRHPNQRPRPTINLIRRTIKRITGWDQFDTQRPSR
jgi:hypothetical protein